MKRISLSEAWEFRFDDQPGWRPIAVPGCWELLDGVPKDRAGPAWYRMRFAIPESFAGCRLWLRFGAVSYGCEVFVDGQEVGRHRGLWDAFAIEITGAAPGKPSELLVRVEKPAGLRAGPVSDSLPARFPLRETLAGFLPYVWGQIFGGIWQDVELVATGQVVFEDVLVRGDADGRVSVEATTSAPTAVAVEIRDPAGELVFRTIIDPRDQRPTTKDQGPRNRGQVAGNEPEEMFGPWSSVLGQPTAIAIETYISAPRPWSPGDPALYEARLTVEGGDERVVRFGLRSLAVDGTTMMLNGQPLYPRMALSWGWYPEALHSNPGPERVRADFARLKALGYNGVKLCLWFPPHYYFDLADELGMLLWVELPMWLPNPTPFFREQTPHEYERLVRQARGHPSVIVYTLGCELNRAVGADVLEPLYHMIKGLAGDALVRDNSGSGEAYGGLLNESADFYDYHFYSELQFFRGLLDSFSTRWRPEKPWLFGEFCDQDTFRDPKRFDQRPRTKDQNDTVPATNVAGMTGLPSPLVVGPSSLVAPSWWASADPAANPQGARWLYELPYHAERLHAAGLLERADELRRVSERHALLHRKYTLELARSYREVSGYVVSGEADTPISTAGMWDDFGRLKFEPAEFRAFNADLVVLVGWDKRRGWVAGGDRAAHWDTWSYPAGALVRPHLIASHYGRARGPAEVAWSVAFDGEPPFASGAATTAFELAPGDLRELAVAEFVAPHLAAPRRATLRASVRIGAEIAENSWPLWFFPRDPWRDAAGIALADPGGRLSDLKQIAPEIDQGPKTNDQGSKSHNRSLVFGHSSLVITTAWTREVATFVEQGGSAIVLLALHGPPGPLPTAEMPFWREAVRLVERHPAWGNFPHDSWAGMQFFGCASDCALDIAGMGERVAPILLRLDTRTMRVHAYAAELRHGRGRAIVSTLRFEGGGGEQPIGIGRNTAAAYLLRCWARYLSRSLLF
jgi:hypothetical protein